MVPLSTAGNVSSTYTCVRQKKVLSPEAQVKRAPSCVTAVKRAPGGGKHNLGMANVPHLKRRFSSMRVASATCGFCCGFSGQVRHFLHIYISARQCTDKHKHTKTYTHRILLSPAWSKATRAGILIAQGEMHNT